MSWRAVFARGTAGAVLTPLNARGLWNWLVQERVSRLGLRAWGHTWKSPQVHSSHEEYPIVWFFS